MTSPKPPTGTFPTPPPYNPMPGTNTTVFACDPDRMNWPGATQLYSTDLPPKSWATLYRVNTDTGKLEVVRGGAWLRDGFVVTDTEMPLYQPSNYVLRVILDTPYVYHNWFVNPSFEHPTTPLLGWATEPNRSLLSASYRGEVPAELRSKYALVSAHTGAVTSGSAPMSSRLLLRGTFDSTFAWTPNATYRVTGQVNVTPRISVWSEARSSPATTDPTMTVPPARAWNNTFFTGSTWEQILGMPTGDTLAAGTLFVGICNASGALIPGSPLVQAMRIETTAENLTLFNEFDVEIKAPTSVPAGSYIGFFQGDNTGDPNEFLRNWQFDNLMFDQSGVYPDVAPMPYFDGSMAVPNTPEGIGYIQPEGNQYDYQWDSEDETLKWIGTAEASGSVYTGAKVLGAYLTGCEIPVPSYINGHSICEPVLISDPILPKYGMWVGLLSISALSWTARRELLNIIGRHAPVAVSQARATPSAEFVFMTSTLAERKQFIEIMNTGRILMIRNPDASYPETEWYVSIGDVSEERILPDHRDPRRRWRVPIQVVDRPSTVLIAAKGQSWGAVRDTYHSWDAMEFDNEDWAAVLLGGGLLGESVQMQGLAHNLAVNAATTTMPTAPWEPAPEPVAAQQDR